MSIGSKLTDGLVKSITYFVSSVLGVDTPKFSKTTRNLYFNFGINKPWLEPDWSVANGVVILVNDDTDIFYSLIILNLIYPIQQA